MAKKVAEPPKKRGQTVPVPKWWIDRIQAAKGDRTDEDLAKELRQLGVAIANRHTVMRTRNGEVPTLELVDALSALLKVGNPFLRARSEAEALQMAGIMANTDRLLRMSDAQAAVLNAGVADSISESQPILVNTDHASSGAGHRRKRERGVGTDRSGT